MTISQANDGPILANCEIDLYNPGPETFEWLIDEQQPESEILEFQYLTTEET